MIRTWLLIVLVLGLGAAAAWSLHADAGYVLISHGRWILETTLLGLLAALVVGLLLLVYGSRLLVGVFRLPSILRGAIGRRRAAKARESFEQGLLRLMEGQFKRAEIELIRRAADHRLPQLNYLAAARAAQQLGVSERRDHYLRLAAQSGSPTDAAVLLTQAELQLEAGDPAAARASLQSLIAREPQHAYAQTLLAQSLAGLGEWEALRQLLAEGGRSRAPETPAQRALQLRVLNELIAAAVEHSQLDRLKATWAGAATSLKSDRALRLQYARALHRLNADNDAAALIAEALKTDWDGGLVRLYGQLGGGDAVARLATIEQWLGLYGERAELLLTAGRACLANKLWGKARSYLEAAAQAEASPEAYLALAQLAEQTQNPDEAAKYHRRGLELAAG